MKNAIGQFSHPYGKKKEKMREHLLIIRQLGVKPPSVHYFTKIARKLFFQPIGN
jgi:hypothetical protein